MRCTEDEFTDDQEEFLSEEEVQLLEREIVAWFDSARDRYLQQVKWLTIHI